MNSDFVTPRIPPVPRVAPRQPQPIVLLALYPARRAPETWLRRSSTEWWLRPGGHEAATHSHPSRLRRFRTACYKVLQMLHCAP
jgi:hypothetical protein